MNGEIVVVSFKFKNTILVVHKAEEGYNVIIDDPVRGARTAKPSFVLRNIQLLRQIVDASLKTVEKDGIMLEEEVQHG